MSCVWQILAITPLYAILFIAYYYLSREISDKPVSVY